MSFIMLILNFILRFCLNSLFALGNFIFKYYGAKSYHKTFAGTTLKDLQEEIFQNIPEMMKDRLKVRLLIISTLYIIS